MNKIFLTRIFLRSLSSALAILILFQPITGITSPSKEINNTPNAINKDPWQLLENKHLSLRSASALVVDEQGKVIYSKQADRTMPIASITKLMTAVVVLDAGVDLDTLVTISKADRDLVRLTGSRLKYGKATLSRRNLLKIALMSSENRAAAALGRTTFPGGTAEFIRAMNRKARKLNMSDSRFVDATGLETRNVSSAQDLVKLMQAAQQYSLIKQATTSRATEVKPYRRLGSLRYANTNRLLKNDKWRIRLSKTGYINESGRCLVMQAHLFGRDLYIVLLNSFGKLTPFGDSNRLRKWIAQGLATQKSATLSQDS